METDNRGWEMRTIVMLTCLLIAGTCHAEDPLETLNTVEDTVSTMERTLQSHADRRVESGILPDQELYFVSDEPLGARGWVLVRPCPRESRPNQVPTGAESCAEVTGDRGGYFWPSSEASAAELKPGVAVIAHLAKEGTWFLARVTDVSELSGGFVSVSAPFKVPVKGLRIVEN